MQWWNRTELGRIARHAILENLEISTTNLSFRYFHFLIDLLEILCRYEGRLCDYSRSFFPPNPNIYVRPCLAKWSLNISHCNILIQRRRRCPRGHHTNHLLSILRGYISSLYLLNTAFREYNLEQELLVR